MNRTVFVLASLALATGACKKSEQAAPKAEPTTAPAAPDQGPATPPVVDAEAAAAAKNLADIKAALDRNQAAFGKEAARWTPELEAKVVALRDGTYQTADDAIVAILASEHRTPGNADRDQYRHPRETLAFVGITPTSNVVELGAGAGWYTELLAPLLAKGGSLTAVGPDPAGPADKMSTVYGKRLEKMLTKSPGLFGAVKRVAITPPGALTLGPAGSADVVIAFREMHNWVEDKNLDAYLAAINAVLKDGGTFALEEHRSKPDTKVEDAALLGYLPEAWVIAQVTAAGFDLAGQSEINANPKDTKDYKEGVWALPPALRNGEVDRAKYVEIGESDRMTLKFTKRPAGK